MYNVFRNTLLTKYYPSINKTEHFEVRARHLPIKYVGYIAPCLIGDNSEIVMFSLISARVAP
jgi:hypothetical protein